MKKIASLTIICLFTTLIAQAQTDTIYSLYSTKFIGEIVSVTNDTLSFIALEDFQKYTRNETVAPKKIATAIIYKALFTHITPKKQNIADSLALNKKIEVIVSINGTVISTNSPKSIMLRDPANNPQQQTASYYFVRGSRRQIGSIVIGLVGGLVGGIATGISAGNGKFPAFGCVVLGGTGITAFIMNIAGISDYAKGGRLLDDGKIGNYNTQPTR